MRLVYLGILEKVAQALCDLSAVRGPRAGLEMLGALVADAAPSLRPIQRICKVFIQSAVRAYECVAWFGFADGLQW